jgi:hypothetical protein
MGRRFSAAGRRPTVFGNCVTPALDVHDLLYPEFDEASGFDGALTRSEIGALADGSGRTWPSGGVRKGVVVRDSLKRLVDCVEVQIEEEDGQNCQG